MGVEASRNSEAENVIFRSGLRLEQRTMALANGTTTVLDTNLPPALFLNAASTAATVRLNNADLRGTVYFIANRGAGTLTVTDNAGSPATIAALATNTGGVFLKNDAGSWTCMSESATIA